MVDSDAPEWFRQAIATEPECGSVAVAGADISYRAWGPEGAGGIVLVHGGAAHARWWDHVAPLLSVRHRVVAVDLSGHGDSDRRETYRLRTWAEETLAAAGAARMAPRPVVVGHSMGGYVAYAAALEFGARLEGVVTIDSPVRDLTPEEKAARGGAFRNLRTYPTRAQALAHWRPVPAQPDTLPYVGRYIAEHSLRRNGSGWSWKFDPGVFSRSDNLSLSALRQLECRAAVFRAEFGMVTEPMADAIYDRLGRAAPTVELPTAGHAPMIDQPLALVTGLRTLLADWEHSVSLHPGRAAVGGN